MISIEAWRSSIGVHNNCKINHINRVSKCLNTLNSASLLLSSLLFTVLSAAVIGTLLRIGCIETNPGPTGGCNEGKFKPIYWCVIIFWKLKLFLVLWWIKCINCKLFRWKETEHQHYGSRNWNCYSRRNICFVVAQ